jgi:hypothetical protein
VEGQRREADAAELARTRQKRERAHLASPELVHIEEAGGPELNVPRITSEPVKDAATTQMVRIQSGSCHAPDTRQCEYAML